MKGASISQSQESVKILFLFIGQVRSLRSFSFIINFTKRRTTKNFVLTILDEGTSSCMCRYNKRIQGFLQKVECGTYGATFSCWKLLLFHMWMLHIVKNHMCNVHNSIWLSSFNSNELFLMHDISNWHYVCINLKQPLCHCNNRDQVLKEFIKDPRSVFLQNSMERDHNSEDSLIRYVS